MIVEATTKFLGKKADRLIEVQSLLADQQDITPNIRLKAAEVERDSVGWSCIMVSASIENGLHVEFYARKSIASDHWETVTIKISPTGGSVTSLLCTCLRNFHFGFPCKHRIVALKTAENEVSLRHFRSLLNYGAKHWYDSAYHVDIYARQYVHTHTFELPAISELMEREL